MSTRVYTFFNMNIETGKTAPFVKFTLADPRRRPYPSASPLNLKRGTWNLKPFILFPDFLILERLKKNCRHAERGFLSFGELVPIIGLWRRSRLLFVK
jgi:hypothetical protein